MAAGRQTTTASATVAQALRAAIAKELGIHEQGGTQAAAGWLGPVDFDMGQLFWEIRDAVVVAAPRPAGQTAPRARRPHGHASAGGSATAVRKMRHRRGSLANFYGTFSSRPDAMVNHLS
jgi:hypothetical protein